MTPAEPAIHDSPPPPNLITYLLSDHSNMRSTAVISSLSANTKSMAKSARQMMKKAKDTLKDKAKKVDWKKVGKRGVKVGWEVAKMSVQITMVVLSNSN
jgi:hypothetical protein